MLARLVTRPLARLVLVIYLYGLVWSSGWANLYEEPRTLHIKIKALPQALSEGTSLPSLTLSVIQKGPSPLSPSKKHILDADLSPLTLFPPDSSFKSWMDKKGKSLGVQWTHQALGTFHIQWDGSVLLKGRGAEAGLAEPAPFYKIQTPGLMKLQDVYLEHLSLKAQSAFINGQNAIKQLSLKLGTAIDGKESSLFQGCVLGPHSFLQSQTVHLKGGSFVNAGTFHVRDEGTVTLHQRDFLNLHHVSFGQKTSLRGVALFDNHDKISGGTLDLQTETFLNTGQLAMRVFRADIQADGLNEGEIKGEESLSLHSKGLLENKGTLKASSLTLQADDILENTGALEGETVLLSSQDALVMDGTLEGTSISLSAKAFQGQGKLKGDKRVSLVLGQGSFQGELLSQDTLSLQINEAFLNEGAIAAEQALALGLNEKGTLTNHGHLVGATLNLAGPGRVLNYGSLYGKKSFSVHESQIENHKLMKSDEQIILAKGELSNHDTFISPSLLLQGGVQLINKVNASQTAQTSDTPLMVAPKGFVIEKDVTCQKAASLINQGHALIGGSLQGELDTFINSGIMDACTYGLSLDEWTHPGLILGKGYLKTKRGHSTGVIEGEIELEVSDTFTNQGHAKLMGLRGRGIFTNLSQLSLLEGDKHKPNLDIDTFHNGSWNESQAKGKSLLTFKALNSHTLKKFINHEGQEVKGDSLFISSQGSFLNEGHVDAKTFASFGKAVNSGSLKSSFLNAGTEFVNTPEAELKINTGLFYHKLLNEGEIEAQDLTVHHLLNQGSLKARVLTTEAKGKTITNEGTVHLDKLMMQGGSLLNQGKGKIFIAQEASLRKRFLPRAQTFSHLSVINEGLIQTPTLYSEASTFLNQGKVEGTTRFHFTHLDNAGEVILPQGNILIRQGFRNRGKILGQRLKKESPDVDNEGEILSQVFSLNGKLINKGKLFVLEKADFALTDPALRNEATGEMCLTQLTVPLEVPLAFKNAGILEIVKSCNLPPQTTLFNEQGGRLSVTKSHMKVHRLENAGLFSCSDGTYKVKETLLGPTSVFSFKGTEKTTYLYNTFENEGVIESSKGLDFKVTSYLTKIGTLSILGPLYVTLLGRQNVVDFYRKATLHCPDQVIFKAQLFEHKGSEEIVLPRCVSFTVDSFLNQGRLKGETLFICAKSFANEGATILADIETDKDLSIVAETFTSQKGSLIAKEGNLSIRITGKEGSLGASLYDGGKLYYHSNGATLAAGKDLSLWASQGSFYNHYGTIAAHGGVHMAVGHMLRSTAGLIWSKKHMYLKASVLELLRENCRSEPVYETRRWIEKSGAFLWKKRTECSETRQVGCRYYDYSDASLIQVDNTADSGDLTLAVNSLKVKGSHILAGGWIKDRHYRILTPPTQSDQPQDSSIPWPSCYSIEANEAKSPSIVKGRQGIDLSAANMRLTGSMDSLNVRLRAKTFTMEGDKPLPCAEVQEQPLFFVLSEVFQHFAARQGLFVDQGEEALLHKQPRYRTRLAESSRSSLPPLQGSRGQGTSPLPRTLPPLVVEGDMAAFLVNHLANLYMDAAGSLGNLYRRLHENAFNLHQAIITRQDVERATEALIFYEARQVCHQAVEMVHKRQEALEAVLGIPASARRKAAPSLASAKATERLTIEAHTINLKGAHCEADDLHIQARKSFKASAKKKGVHSYQGDTHTYRETIEARTTLKGRQKAHVMGEEAYHVSGIDAYAGPQGGRYGSQKGAATSTVDHLHHHQTITEHHDGGWLGTSSTTTHQYHTSTAVGNTYTSEGPFLYQAASDKEAILEGTQVIGQDKGHIKGQELLMKPGVSTQESSTTSSKEGLFQSKSSHESARRASFLPSLLVFPDNVLHFNNQKVQLTGTHLYAHHVKDDSQHFHMGMAKETCTSHKTQSHSHVAGYAETTTERGQEIGCPSTVQVESWETSAHKGTGATMTFEGVSGRIGHLASSKDFQAKAVPLKKWEKTTRHSAGFQAPILEGKLDDPLVNSYQGVRTAEHSADQATSTLKAAHESLKAVFLAARMVAGDPSALIDLLMRYVNLSWSFSQSTSFFETQHEVGCDLSFASLTLDNEATLLQGFIRANNLHITSDSFTVLPLKEESRQHHASAGGSVSFPGLGVSYHRSSSTHTETIHTPSRVTADHLYLNGGNAKISGTQIRARVIDAIIHNSLTLESVLNVLGTHTGGFDLSSKGDMRFENRTRVREKLDELSSLVGVEQFYLRVGGLLHLRSALYGQRGEGDIPPRQLSTLTGCSYYVRPLPRQDNACGFYGLLAGRVYKNPRAEGVEALLKASPNPEIRALVAPEIMEGLVEGSHSFLPQAEVMRALGDGDETAQGQVRQWATSPEVYEAFIQGHVARPHAMLSYVGGDKTSTMDALAQLYGFGLEIYHLDEAGKLRLVHQFAGPPSGLAPVRLVHVALEEGGPLNHFERLEVDPEHIDATQILEEAIPERDHESGYVVNLPLGTAREFASTLEEFTEWMDAHQEEHGTAREEEGGLDEGEQTLESQLLEDQIAAALGQEGATEGEIKEVLATPQLKQILQEVRAFKEAHGGGHIEVRLENGQHFGDPLQEGLLVLGRGALAVDTFATQHPRLTHYGLMAFDVALSGPGGFVLNQVAEKSGFSESIAHKVDQAERWLANHLEHQGGLDRDSADLLASAGSFGIQMAIPLLGTTKSKQVVDAAHKVAHKVHEGVKKVQQSAKKEQPWKIRPGQEWKKKLQGKGQQTQTPGHSVRSKIEAVKVAKRPDVTDVNMDLGVNRLLPQGQKVKPNRRPDISYKTKDGKIHQIEIPSKSDDRKKLMKRMQETQSRFPEEMRGNEIEVIPIKNKKKIPIK